MQAPDPNPIPVSTDDLVFSYRGAPSDWAAQAEDDLRDLPSSDMSVVVDLSNVDTVDSLTLGLLVLTQKRLRMNGGDLSLVCDRPAVLEQLRRTGLDRSFALRATVS